MNELELILTDIFSCCRADLYLDASSIAFKDKEFRRLDKILKDRGRTIPIQYILGSTEFMGLKLKVKKGVLIPRPETEILVEAVIEKVLSLKSQVKSLKIIDIGTGSGCIAIALAKFLKNIDIVATDISKQAIDLVRENAKSHKLQEKIKFIQADIFTPLEKVTDEVNTSLTGFNHKFFKTGDKFDIIVSNPPYVPTSEIGIFDASIDKEPKIALDGGRDGLDFYRRLSAEAGGFLKKDGALFLELGDGQASRIKEIFSNGWEIEEFRRDYQNIERVCAISYH